ncbi:hypothetical protein KBD61_06130 [Patescibacteria group bacterium]|nr:hypothetical protein [Patescibacteria group bacterium]MBP9710564.1 hypothetical protein [Patescibacteria group bacterium]
MRQALSISLRPEELKRTRHLARKRGFSVISDYVRFLVAQDDDDLISADELVKRSKETEILYKQGKLIKARSIKDLLK